MNSESSEYIDYDRCSECGREIKPGEQRASVVYSWESCKGGVVTVAEAVQVKCYCDICAPKMDFRRVEVPYDWERKVKIETAAE